MFLCVHALVKGLAASMQAYALRIYTLLQSSLSVCLYTVRFKMAVNAHIHTHTYLPACLLAYLLTLPTLLALLTLTTLPTVLALLTLLT